MMRFWRALFDGLASIGQGFASLNPFPPKLVSDELAQARVSAGTLAAADVALYAQTAADQIDHFALVEALLEAGYLYDAARAGFVGRDGHFIASEALDRKQGAR